MITNKILALILSLCTAGSPATGAVLGNAAGTVANNVELPKFPTTAVVEKQISNPQNGGQTINLPLNLKNSCDSIAPIEVQLPNENCVVADEDNSVEETPVANEDAVVETPKAEVPEVEVPVIENPKIETPVVEEPKVEAPKVETPVKEEPKTEAPKVETPATTPSTTVPSGVPANPNNKSFKYMEAVEKEILTYVNEERSKAGLNPLTWEEQMRPIARYKSNNMLQYNYFEHNTPSLNNANPMDLAIKYFKYSTNSYGENLFYSQGYAESTTTAKYLVDQWMNSPGHRANILNGSWTKMSAGVVFSSQGNWVYATQHFSTK
ncbi:CAP domain-containing protein [Clostridium sp. UBA4548]|uniref:CAP domain-containing protein n=1 Tax=Clostridium sp. UBA4548 TaxID=1946361 RepID=UPI0025C45B9F|nr:CAP domain-containing protein [Clostridium sp. UBA4548]